MRATMVLLLTAVLCGAASAAPKRNPPKAAPANAKPADAKPADAPKPPDPAATDTPVAKAKVHADEGTHFFDVQQYDKAADAYQQAYLLDPQPAYLYASAQAQRLGGDCVKAIRSYKAFLRTKPADESKALKNIERCEQEVKDHPPVDPARPPNGTTGPTGPGTTTGVTPPVVIAPPRPAPPPKPWSRDFVGHGLVGGGLVVAAAGFFVYLGGHDTIATNNTSTTYDQFSAGRANLDSAKSKQTLGVSAVALGGALVIGGVLHYVLHTEPDDAPITAALAPSGVTLLVTRSF
jgi:tetratricopeptide (TPR) repeat protein